MSSTAQVLMADQLGFWRGVYEEHGPAILAFLQGRIANREDAEELLQETFLRAIKSSDQVRNRDAVRSYLFTTAHNLLRNRHRRARISPLVSGVELEAEGQPGDAADSRAHLAGILGRLERTLADLSPDHRRAFQMAVLDGLPYGEIAERTGWSPSAVKVNVFRARRKVISELADLLPGGPEVRP